MQQSDKREMGNAWKLLRNMLSMRSTIGSWVMCEGRYDIAVLK